MIFGFFSRWKKAGKAVGISGGAGKLCAFDQDGNVVSSGISPDDIPTQQTLYRHSVTIWSDNQDPTVNAVVKIYATVYSNRSSAYTLSQFMTLLPDNADASFFEATGYGTTPLFETKQFSVYAIDITPNDNFGVHMNPGDNGGDFYISIDPDDLNFADHFVLV